MATDAGEPVALRVRPLDGVDDGGVAVAAGLFGDTLVARRNAQRFREAPVVNASE
jgi:hypothetical protein